jgi:hypothetical protein
MRDDGTTYQTALRNHVASVPRFSGLTPVPADLPAYANYDGNVLEYWREVAVIVEEHEDIAPWFRVYLEERTNGTVALWALARTIDPAWRVGWQSIGPGTTPRNNVHLRATRTTSTVGLDLVFKGRQGWQVAGRVASPLDARSRALFDIRGLLTAAAEDQMGYPGLPAWSTSAPYRPASIYDYYILLAERGEQEGNSQLVDSMKLDSLRCFAGGTSAVIQAEGNFFGNIDVSNGWLTQRPDRRPIGVSEPVYLGFIRRFFTNVEDSTPYLEVVETLEDGSTRTTTHFENSEVSADDYQPVVFPVGCEVLGIGPDTLHYTVQVTMNRPPQPPLGVSPRRTFIVDRTQYEKEYYLAYLNGMNMPEIIRCTGRRIDRLEVSYRRRERVRRVNDGVEIGDRENLGATVERVITYATGYLGRADVNTIAEELPRSPRLYQITPTGFTPLVLKSKSFSLGSDRENLHALTIECDLGIVDRNYAEYQDILANPDVDVWTEANGDPWLEFIRPPFVLAYEEPWTN